MKKHLVIGMGEVGTALFEVLADKYDVVGIDNKEEAVGKFDFIHICFPYFDGFAKEVKKYKKKYQKHGGICVNHSTVPLGVSRECGSVHSPIRGRHPELKESILTFTKYLGGEGSEEVAKAFEKVGMKCKTFNNPEETEMSKLVSLLGYGWNIILQKEVKRLCDKYDLDFENVYTENTKSYNEGYEKLGYPQFKKYVLKHMRGKIGGHCIVQNMPHLKKSAFSKFLMKQNKKLTNV